ncbi:MAG: winged helix-turn-helix transcriptional regulator [Pseudomonadota bacterium]
MAESNLERFENNESLRKQVDKLNQFIPISFGLLDNPEFRNRYMTKKRFRTYLWLRRNVIRGFKGNDPARIYLNYWMNGKLAASLTQEKLSKDLNLPKSTISDHLRQLEQDGVLKIDIIPAEETEDGQEHRVYVLGSCLKAKEEWFIDEIFK